LGTEYDNSVALNFWGDFELVVSFGVAPTAQSTVDLYLTPTLDGTNYCDGGGSTQPTNEWRGSWSLAAATSQRLPLHGIALPPTKFKIFVVNNGTGQNFAASGNTVKMLPYREQYT
jgi:hypothetical protein